MTRRGACPSLSAPMATGDGLLVRLNPRGGALRPDQLAGIARQAARRGNGVLEITARGSLQIRGLSPLTVADFAAGIAVLGIAADEGAEIRIGPLAGRDASEIADPRPLAEAIRAGVAGRGLTGRLAPKVSVVVDGGGALGLGALAADVRLEAVPAGMSDGVTPTPDPSPQGGGGQVQAPPLARSSMIVEPPVTAQFPSPLWGGAGVGVEPDMPVSTCDRAAMAMHRALLWRVAVGGDGRQATVLGQGDAAAVVEAALGCLAVLAGTGRSARARDLPPDAFAKAASGLRSVHKPAVADRATPVGAFTLSDGSVARGFALPFGQVGASELAAFADGLEADWEIRLAPGRGLLVLGLSVQEDERVVQLARDGGMVADPRDPRLRIAACAGAPACASAHLPTKKIAAAVAAERPDLLERAPMLHVSGCAKKCARPAGPSVALVGSRYGCDVEGDGMAADAATGRALMQLADRFAARRRRSA